MAQRKHDIQTLGENKTVRGGKRQKSDLYSYNSHSQNVECGENAYGKVKRS